MSDYRFFLDRINFCLERGRGFSLFNAPEDEAGRFAALCREKGIEPVIVRASAPQDMGRDFSAVNQPVIFVQDLPLPDFLAKASHAADRVIFPLWFRRIPICFFSSLGRGE